ncbi:hypothetical protein BHM03_00029328 [Ensete ventricosum]|nr:hypothetical protein BHM03_00029328 [Ensete ventricosum]
MDRERIVCVVGIPMASLLFAPSRLPTSLYATLVPFIYSSNPHRLHSQSLSSNKTPTKERALIVSSALAESNSSKSLGGGGGRGEDGSDDDDDEDLLPLLRELSDCLLLPPDYLSSLPHDLRLDVSEGDLFLRSDNAMISLGKRLVSAGRRFQAMGQYADGEPQKVKA